MGPVEQADFINGALKISTDYTPDQLLVVLHQIERACRRERTIHWGPRTLDLDIIFFNELVLQSDTLVIPHPEAFQATICASANPRNLWGRLLSKSCD